MFGDLRRSLSVHKRAMVPRAYISSSDIEDNADLLRSSLGRDTASPTWKLSLPHVLVATIVPFLFGYHIGVVNEPLETISVDLGFHGNTLQEGFVVSTCLAGAFVGCLFSGWIADEVGRRRAFQLCALPMVMGAAICATAKNLTGMLLGRFLVGTGLGVGPPVASLYVTEQGRNVEAEAVLEKLLGGSEAKATILELSNTGRGGEANTIKLIELLCGRHSRVVFIGSTLFALQQLSGINAVFCFSSTVFRRAGVFSDLANISVGIANFIGSTIALALMDKLGRKALLLCSFFGMAVCTVLQVLATALSASNPTAFYLSVGGMLLFVLMYAVGAGPVPGLLLPEIFPSRIRAKAMAVSMAVHWVLNFFVGLLFLHLLDVMGPGLLYSTFGAFCLLAVVFVKRNVLETKGKSLQEIEIALLPQSPF
ncbi:UNVERIFIED_CONTAM: putative plastidic glucose transporter 2 [Sesamum radiatum]|uniref:Plastidic glucose transporter 2 n=1 Tax=Sesamum radiatum TaxID=300843 RepID=A0AAW2KRV8_SESRA